MFSRKVTTVKPEIKHTVLLWVFIIVVTIVVPGQQGCIEEVEQKILEMEGNFKKKKKMLQIILRAQNGPLGRVSNHSELESLKQFAEV